MHQRQNAYMHTPRAARFHFNQPNRRSSQHKKTHGQYYTHSQACVQTRVGGVPLLAGPKKRRKTNGANGFVAQATNKRLRG